MRSHLKVAVLGATGAVGREFLDLFKQRRFPIDELRLLASPRSSGQVIDGLTVRPVSASAFDGIDLAFFSAGAARSKEWAPVALQSGAVVIDNSSAFRMDEDVPLVVPEVNWSSVQASDRLFANPNCCTIILLMAIAPLRALGKMRRLIVSTYQSASGGGAALMDDLVQQTKDLVEGKAPKPQVSPHVYGFNVFSHNTPIDDTGHNEEEAKVMAETRKILDQPTLQLNVTCVRVPVLRAHCESITIEFEGRSPDESQVREALARFPGVQVVDDRQGNKFPMPSDSSGKNDVLVGRIRRDLDNPHALSLFVSGDQLLKGAALNAVQIAEQLLVDRPNGLSAGPIQVTSG